MRYDRLCVHQVRKLAPWALGLAGVLAARGAVGGPAALALAGALLAAAFLVLVLGPRTAHRWFRAGRFRRAELAYRALRWLRLGREARGALEVSAAACLLGRERYVDGVAALARVDPSRLGEAARVAWLNNRAYAAVRGGGDAARALAEIDEALALRPDLAGLRHTRGLALLGLGRIDEAVRELDAVWRRRAGEETAPLLEAERCFDLGQAWLRKGEVEYAADYFERARRAAPGSPWAERAAERLPVAGGLPAVVSELLEGEPGAVSPG